MARYSIPSTQPAAPPAPPSNNPRTPEEELAGQIRPEEGQDAPQVAPGQVIRKRTAAAPPPTTEPAIPPAPEGEPAPASPLLKAKAAAQQRGVSAGTTPRRAAPSASQAPGLRKAPSAAPAQEPAKVAPPREVVHAPPIRKDPQPAPRADLRQAIQASPPTETITESVAKEAADPRYLPATQADTQAATIFSGGEAAFNASMLIVPAFHIVQRTGDLSTVFEKGELVLDKAFPIPRPARLVVLGLGAVKYVERIEGEGGGGGNICDSREEIRQLGGTLNWNEAHSKGIPLYQTLVPVFMLIERSELIEDDEGRFPFYDETTGKAYAIAKWNAKGSGFTHGVRPFFSAWTLQLRRQWWAGWWDFNTADWKTRSGNWIVRPQVTFRGATEPGFRQQIAQWLTMGVSVTEDEASDYAT